MATRRAAKQQAVEPSVRMATLDGLLRTAIELRRHVESVAREFELSAPQARLVLILDEPMRMQRAAVATACEPSHLTALADQLEAASLITREADPDDRRARRLCLTDKGIRLRTRLAPAMLDEAPVVGGLDDGQCAALIGLLDTQEQS